MYLAQDVRVRTHAAYTARHSHAGKLAIVAVDRYRVTMERAASPALVHNFHLLWLQLEGLNQPIPSERAVVAGAKARHRIFLRILIGIIMRHPVVWIVLSDAVTGLQAKRGMSCEQAIAKPVVAKIF